MMVSGVPRRRKDHAQALVCVALEMRDFIANYTFRNGQQVMFRIGINSAPMIGGLISKLKFVYEVWGDAVNVASRLESHGTEGEFACEPRGTVNIKGKGEMEVWLVLSAR